MKDLAIWVTYDRICPDAKGDSAGMLFLYLLLSMIVIVLPVQVEETQKSRGQGTQHQMPVENSQIPMEMMGNSILKIQEMRNKIETEKDLAIRNELMRQHIQMMKIGVNMMSMTGGQNAMMSQIDTRAMPMPNRISMTEKNMGILETMTGNGRGMGMMSYQGGGEGMMGGSFAKSMDDRFSMIERNLSMIQETLNGMMMQQEMMIK